MPEIKPRFEFRTFAQNFGIVEEKMRQLSSVGKIRESLEIYIMSAGNNEYNTKIRNNSMDIKVLIKKEKGLEQWNPRLKCMFPMQTSVIRDEVFPAFSVKVSEFKRDVYTLKQYINEIIKPHPELTAVNVFKRRFAFSINDCIAEIAEVYINGAKIITVNLESDEVDAILKAMDMVKLTNYDNINYLLAIKRVVGMEHLAEESVYRAI